MAKGIPLMGRDPDGKAKMINVDENGNVKVQQSGTMVSSGLLANRPLASAVPPGFAYYSWDAPEGQEMAYSDGTNWEVKS